jgi:Lrp/AsnC family transcriptional regulator, leucine-responsive regulatory protein
MDQLDAFDRAILAILQEDASLSYTEVGERVNLSASATLRRVQRMKENGTVIATRAIVNPEHVGQPLIIIVELSLENEHVETLEDIKQVLNDDPHVQQCYYVTGEADLFAVLAMPNMSVYTAFTERHFLGNASIKRFKTSVVMDTVKTTTAYPV